ncbi:S9 family peptidase [Amnibacterium flavum]|uniref:Acyl-peptide hydrolase n=2 Tax=Amnibacterium flavum TaxID=2173173 RepID=A0A2V1HQY5_9MICO|nr:S9 family peptidase [Amnibacterium flavum]
MTPDAARVAFVSDRRGTPELWIQDVVPGGESPPARRIPLSDDPVLSVSWSADGNWLACAVATGGGVRSQVWVVRPDGSDARRIAGSESLHAELGPWTRSGHRVVVTFPPGSPGDSTRALLADPATGDLYPLAQGDLITVLDLSVEERLVILRDGRRGHQFCVVVDRVADQSASLLPHTQTGATDVAILRPAPHGSPTPLIAYLVTEEGRPRRQLVSVPLGPGGARGPVATLAEREDAELEGLDADDAGDLLLLVWNVAGRSELELFDTVGGTRTPVPALPGYVATHPVLSRDGRSVVLSIEGPERPRELWHLDTESLSWTRISEVPELPDAVLVQPTLETFTGHDGLPLTGWLYRPPANDSDDGAPAVHGAAMLHLHGGPEAQERPTFSAQHQAVVAAGITVFAPNVRGSSGFGREFVHADDIEKRYDAFADVVSAAEHLVATGVADPNRIAVTGRSYGGYLTFATLAFSPGVFASGVAVCGMSDLHGFYRETEPWIASAAFSKYGHPQRDRKLLRDLSPLRAAGRIEVPLLVAHGDLDTNVPVGESRRMVRALTKLGRPVEYLEQPGEGHEYRRVESRASLVTAMVRFLDRTLGRRPGSIQ